MALPELPRQSPFLEQPWRRDCRWWGASQVCEFRTSPKISAVDPKGKSGPCVRMPTLGPGVTWQQRLCHHRVGLSCGSIHQSPTDPSLGAKDVKVCFFSHQVTPSELWVHTRSRLPSEGFNVSTVHCQKSACGRHLLG